ncbi:MAG: hypothetical protein ACRCZY_03060, partial [Phocaeicola sp.]
MTQNNNLSVLPFYDDIKYQDYKKKYAYGHIYDLITPIYRLPTFQLQTSNSFGDITEIALFTQDGKVKTDITEDIKFYIRVLKFQGYNLIICDKVFAGKINTLGRYYLTITDGKSTYYSDIFTIVDNVDDCVRITWGDANNLYYEGGHIDYSDGFKNVVYLNADIGKPDYKFDEEGEDRDGFFFPEKQMSEKIYNFTFVAPEYLCDAMRTIRMSDSISIVYEDVQYTCDKFQMTVKWQTQGNLAAVECEFQTNTVIKKIGSG